MSSLAARVGPRLIRAALIGVAALIGLVVATKAGHPDGAGLIEKLGERDASDLLALGGGIVFLVGAVVAIRSSSRAAGEALEERLGDARGAPLKVALSILGYFVVILLTLDLLGVEFRALLLGGAITGVMIGIAAQQTLGNFFAGIVLLIVRPFTVGEQIVMRSGPLGGEYQGRVTEMGLFYIDMVTKHGPVKLPNAGVLASAIGPGARAPRDEIKEVQERAQQAPPAEGGAQKP